MLSLRTPHRRGAVSHRLKAPHHPKAVSLGPLPWPRSKSLSSPRLGTARLPGPDQLCGPVGFWDLGPRPLPPSSPSSSRSRRGQERGLVLGPPESGGCKSLQAQTLIAICGFRSVRGFCMQSRMASADVPVTGSAEGPSTQKRRRCGGVSFLAHMTKLSSTLSEFP